MVRCSPVCEESQGCCGLVWRGVARDSRGFAKANEIIFSAYLGVASNTTPVA